MLTAPGAIDPDSRHKVSRSLAQSLVSTCLSSISPSPSPNISLDRSEDPARLSCSTFPSSSRIVCAFLRPFCAPA